MRKRKDPEPSGEILRSRAERKRSRLDIASKADMARAGRGEHSRCRKKKKDCYKEKKNVYPGKRDLERLGGLGNV